MLLLDPNPPTEGRLIGGYGLIVYSHYIAYNSLVGHGTDAISCISAASCPVEVTRIGFTCILCTHFVFVHVLNGEFYK